MKNLHHHLSYSLVAASSSVSCCFAKRPVRVLKISLAGSSFLSRNDFPDRFLACTKAVIPSRSDNPQSTFCIEFVGFLVTEEEKFQRLGGCGGAASAIYFEAKVRSGILPPLLVISIFMASF